jgi:hypothetical protein
LYVARGAKPNLILPFALNFISLVRLPTSDRTSHNL